MIDILSYVCAIDTKVMSKRREPRFTTVSNTTGKSVVYCKWVVCKMAMTSQAQRQILHCYADLLEKESRQIKSALRSYIKADTAI